VTAPPVVFPPPSFQSLLPDCSGRGADFSTLRYPTRPLLPHNPPIPPRVAYFSSLFLLRVQNLPGTLSDEKRGGERGARRGSAATARMAAAAAAVAAAGGGV